MARQQMPKELEELLFQVEDVDAIQRIQTKWMEYADANAHYEKVYPDQFANLVQANSTFKENKTIPTPPEQMREYNDMIRDEINEVLHEKSLEEKADAYEVEEQAPNTKQKTFDDFKLTFLDMMDQVVPEQTKEKTKQADREKDTNEKTSSFDFKLMLANLDDVTRDDLSKEDMELDRDDYEWEKE